MAAQVYFGKALGLADQMGYRRGQIRSLFHLGLIENETGLTEQAMATFRKVEEFAQETNSLRVLAQLESQQARNSYGDQIEKYLLKQEFLACRKLLLHWERERRAEGRTRCVLQSVLLLGHLFDWKWAV